MKKSLFALFAILILICSCKNPIVQNGANSGNGTVPSFSARDIYIDASGVFYLAVGHFINHPTPADPGQSWILRIRRA